MREIYRRGMTDEVFAWTAASNNTGYLAGGLSRALNAISIAGTLEGPPWVTTPQNTDLMRNTWIAPIPRGTERLGLEHVMGVYVIWNFARNKRGAKKYTTNVGHPGYAHAAVDEVFNKFLIPQMFAEVARGQRSPDEAARVYHRQVGEIFAKWRRRKKI